MKQLLKAILLTLFFSQAYAHNHGGWQLMLNTKDNNYYVLPVLNIPEINSALEADGFVKGYELRYGFMMPLDATLYFYTDQSGKKNAQVVDNRSAPNLLEEMKQLKAKEPAHTFALTHDHIVMIEQALNDVNFIQPHVSPGHPTAKYLSVTPLWFKGDTVVYPPKDSVVKSGYHVVIETKKN